MSASLRDDIPTMVITPQHAAAKKPATAKAPQAAAIGRLDPRQHAVMPAELHDTILDGRQAQMHTAMPGHIVSYNSATMTCSVQVGIQGVQRMQDGTRKNVSIAPIIDVPVHFPGGGGHTMTFPVKPGDECLIIFSERSIDNWFQHGGTMPPSDFRMHDINDAFALVGTRSQGNTLPNVATDTVQMRSDDGKTLVQVDGPNTAIILWAAGAGGETHVFVDGANGEVIMTAPKQVVMHTPQLLVTGQVIAGVGTPDAVTLTQHRHTGSNVPPTPGT